MTRFRIGLAIGLLAAPAAAEDFFVEAGSNGDGSAGNPFGTVQDGVDAAQPGDTVIVRAGTYNEQVDSQRDGAAGSPITIRAEGQVTVANSGRVFRIQHSHHVIEGFVMDGENGDRIPLTIAGDNVTVRNSEVMNTQRDCVDVGSSANVLIEGALIHHCLNPERVTGPGGGDAHGLTGSQVQDLTVRDTEIHSFSGDAIQFDPGRGCPGWDNIVIEGCRLWLGPLLNPPAPFQNGDVPGENAIDTKVCVPSTNPNRHRITVRGTAAWGYRPGARRFIDNMAAFNMKEHIDTVLDGVTVFDSEIAFRLRGPGSRGGAHVRVQNAVVYDVDNGIRYEDDIERLDVYNNTFGRMVGNPFREANADNAGLDVQNNLFLGSMLPAEAPTGMSNLTAAMTDFVDAGNDDYHLADGVAPIDAGVTLAEVMTDRDGTARPQGMGYDVGAYEHCATGGCSGAGGGGAGGAGGAGGGPGTGGTGATGAGGSGAMPGAGGSGATGTGGSGATGTGGSMGTGASTGTGGAQAGGAAGVGAAGGDDPGGDGGCSCRAVGDRSSSPWAALGLLGLAVGYRRRRRV